MGKKRYISAPKDKEAIKAYNMGEDTSEQMSEWSLSEEEFNKLYSSGIFKELNCVCNVCIDDFESEIIDFSKLIMAKETIIKFKNSLPKDEFIKLYSLFLEAINYQTLIAFDF